MKPKIMFVRYPICRNLFNLTSVGKMQVHLMYGFLLNISTIVPLSYLFGSA